MSSTDTCIHRFNDLISSSLVETRRKDTSSTLGHTKDIETFEHSASLCGADYKELE